MNRDNITHKVIVADVRYNSILGSDFMTEYSCDILVQKMCLRVKRSLVLDLVVKMFLVHLKLHYLRM